MRYRQRNTRLLSKAASSGNGLRRPKCHLQITADSMAIRYFIISKFSKLYIYLLFDELNIFLSSHFFIKFPYFTCFSPSSNHSRLQFHIRPPGLHDPDFSNYNLVHNKLLKSKQFGLFIYGLIDCDVTMLLLYNITKCIFL